MRNFKTLSRLIAFYEAIPEENWCTGKYTAIIYDGSVRRCVQHCARGHLGESDETSTPRAPCIPGTHTPWFRWEWLADVNDGRHPDYQQPTPKQRVLAALRDLLTGKLKPEDTCHTISLSEDLANLPIN